MSGEGNSYTTYFRSYDPRLGRWKSPDPVIHPWESDYVAFRDNPILYVDPSGDDASAVVEAVGEVLEQVGDAVVKAAEEAGDAIQEAAGACDGCDGVNSLRMLTSVSSDASSAAQSGVDGGGFDLGTVLYSLASSIDLKGQMIGGITMFNNFEFNMGQVQDDPPSFQKIDLASNQDVEQILNMFKFVVFKTHSGYYQHEGFYDEPLPPYPVEDLFEERRMSEVKANDWRATPILSGKRIWYSKKVIIKVDGRDIEMKRQIRATKNYADLHLIDRYATPILSDPDGYSWGISLRNNVKAKMTGRYIDAIEISFKKESHRNIIWNEFIYTK